MPEVMVSIQGLRGSEPGSSARSSSEDTVSGKSRTSGLVA